MEIRHNDEYLGESYTVPTISYIHGPVLLQLGYFPNYSETFIKHTPITRHPLSRGHKLAVPKFCSCVYCKINLHLADTFVTVRFSKRLTNGFRSSFEISRSLLRTWQFY